MNNSKRKIPKKKYNTMYFKWIKDIYGKLALIDERLDKIEKRQSLVEESANFLKSNISINSSTKP